MTNAPRGTPLNDSIRTIRTSPVTSFADGVPEIAQARRLGHHLTDRVVETYSRVAPEVEQRLLDGLEARWWAANALLHPRQPAATFRGLLSRFGHWHRAA